MVRARAAGSSAGDNRMDRDNYPSHRPRNSKILNNTNCKSGSAFRLREALFDFYVDSNRSVLIAQPDYRQVSVKVVFHLNDLLLGRAYIRNISDGEVRRNLFLDGNACRGVLFQARRAHSCEARVNAKTRYPKQALHAPAYLAGNRFRENRRGPRGSALGRTAAPRGCL